MHIAAIIPYHPQTRHDNLVWTLEGFSQQVLDSDMRLEVLVGIDGGVEADALPQIPPSRHPIALHSLPRMGAAAVRNELVRRAHTTPDLLIFANADTRPDPDMAQQHATTLANLPPHSLVLGAAPWERTNPTVMDTLIDHTPLIFSYCHLQAHHWYSFRVAYSLNLSVSHADFMAAGGFPEQLRPYYYEDLGFAARIVGTERAGVYFAPEARVTHRHNVSLEQYLDREELLGLMAPVLARVCPEPFAALMGGRTVESIAGDFREKLAGTKTIYPPLFRHLQEQCAPPAATLGQGEMCTQVIRRLYQLLMPLRLLAFRVGFLQGRKWTEDHDWLVRRPSGLWRPWVDGTGG